MRRAFGAFMRRFWAKLIAAVVDLLLWVWAAVRLIMDWVGRSTFFEDADSAEGKAVSAFNWLLTTPWYVPAGLASVLTAATIVLLWRSHDRLEVAASEHADAAPERTAKADEAPIVPAQGVNISGSGHVLSIGQTGGVTARTVINQAPAPKLIRLSAVEKNTADGKWEVVLVFAVESPYPVGNLFLGVYCTGIIDMECIPQRTGVSMEGHSGRREGYCFTNLHQAFGTYRLVVRAESRQPVRIEYEFS